MLEINNNKFITHVAQNIFEYDLIIGELPSSTDSIRSNLVQQKCVC